jgi:hypothetical protein
VNIEYCAITHLDVTEPYLELYLWDGGRVYSRTDSRSFAERNRSCKLRGVARELATEYFMGNVDIGVVLDRMEEEPREVGMTEEYHSMVPQVVRHLRRFQTSGEQQ